MDIESLKEALGDEKFKALKTHVETLVSQRDEARNESISGRKGLKEQVTKLQSDQGKLLEKLGIDSVDEVANLPDTKGAAEAAKQYEAKMKRLTAERDDAVKKAEEVSGLRKGDRQKALVAEALAGHEFVARDVVETFVSARLQWEGDELFFKEESGKLISVKDGVASMAKARPELLKTTGTGGAGFRQSAGGTGGNVKGDLSGNRDARTAAISARFPELAANGG